MNEVCLNLFGKNIVSKEGKEFTLEVLKFMRGKLQDFQEETDHVYNLEAVPCEGTSFRLARIDKKKYPDIITAGERVPYYTNSTQLPVNYTSDIFEALMLQDKLQTKYTGGTVFHVFLGEQVEDIEGAKALQAAMSAESTRKQYLCFSRGHPKEDEFIIDRPLTNKSKGKKGDKQEAQTDFQTLWRGRIGRGLDCSLLHAFLHTGRHHQIRRHLARAGHFIFGDVNYGKGGVNRFMRESFGLPRLFLHATRLTLAHPATGETLELFDPLPADLRQVLQRIPNLPSELLEQM